MKQSLKLMAAAGMLMITAAAGCKKNILGELSAGMVFSMNTEAYLAHKVNILVTNANPNSAAVPNVTLTVSGADADKVYEINGGKTFPVTEQMARLVVSPGKPISPSQILSITFKADAPGFMPIQKSVQVSSLDSFSTYTMEMVEIAAPPAGISLNKDVLAVNSSTGAVPSEEHIELPLQTNVDNPQKVDLVIPAGTVFQDKTGAAINADIRTSVSHFNETEKLVDASMFYNVYSRTVKMKKNGALIDQSFNPIATIDISMNGAGKQVEKFNKPIKGFVQIDPGTINISTSRPYQPGDEVEIYSLSEGEDSWNFESKVAVTKNAADQLVASFDIPHLSTYSVRSTNTNCTNKLKINFQRRKSYKANVLHYVEITDASTQNGAILYAFDNVPIEEGGNFTLPNALPSKPINIRVYEYDTKLLNTQLNGKVVGELKNVAACSTPVNITLDVPGITGRDVLIFKITAICTVDNKNIRYQHDGRVQFRVWSLPGSPWRDVGKAVNGDLITDRLGWDSRYDFKTLIQAVNSRGVLQLVEKIRPRAPKKIEFENKPAGTGSIFWTFARKDWIVPEEECAKIAKEFGY